MTADSPLFIVFADRTYLSYLGYLLLFALFLSPAMAVSAHNVKDPDEGGDVFVGLIVGFFLAAVIAFVVYGVQMIILTEGGLNMRSPIWIIAFWSAAWIMVTWLSWRVYHYRQRIKAWLWSLLGR